MAIKPQVSNPGLVADDTLPQLAGVRDLVVIAVLAFLTVVDLFAAQALLPFLAQRYAVSAGAMGLAVNASTLGMACGALGIALLGDRISRRGGIAASLVVLSLPTMALSVAPDLATFAGLRILQGLAMAAAFGISLAYLAEHFDVPSAPGVFAAYVTGNVASNLLGRLIAATIADHAGVSAAFLGFAALNLAGAALAWVSIQDTAQRMGRVDIGSSVGALFSHLRDRTLRAGFAVGFCILFVFIGVFTFVNFVLVAPPLSVGMMQLGLVYFVFLPSIMTTPMAGPAVRRFGAKVAISAGLAVALVGLLLLLTKSLPVLLCGMALVAVGTFFAQAVATGIVSRTATHHKGAASGLYLASYFLGGLVGTAVVGRLFDVFGWEASVFSVGLALVFAMIASFRRF